MKTNHVSWIMMLGAASLAAAVFASEKTGAGPKGGRLLSTTPQPIEFLVTPDRKVEVNFYDSAAQPAAPQDRVVSVTAEPTSGRVPVDLEKTAAGFVSRERLPAGEPYRVVVQIRERPEAKPQNFRIVLNLAECAECKHPEYACACGH